ncbi:unnamed protein product [Symbiodinium sp. CCMP2592]|nr:unnamed protein product [Symbiodinium sp. CCMP2592]
MLRLHVRLRKEGQGGQEAETILVPTEPTKRVHDFKVEIARRAQKLAAFDGCRVICLREGSRAHALIDDEDVVSDVLENGDAVLAEVACLLSPAGVKAVSAPEKEHEATAGPAFDTGETTDGSGAEVEPAEFETGDAASIRYQTLERLAQGLPPQVVEVSATTSTWELAKQIAHAEGIEYEPAEEEVALASSASEDHGRCLCSEVGSRVKLWGYDAAMKIDAAAFSQPMHPQRWAAELAKADICSICLSGLGDCVDSSEREVPDFVVGNRLCQHFFHADCLLKSFAADGKVLQCPCCRGEWLYLKDAKGQRAEEGCQGSQEDGRVLVLVPAASGFREAAVAAAASMTVDELKREVSRIVGSDCQNFVACSRGVVQDDQSLVVTAPPAVYSFCDRGAHAWTIMLTCQCNDQDHHLQWKQKMRSTDVISQVKQALHRAWRIQPSKMQIQSMAGLPFPDHARVGDVCCGVQVEAAVAVILSDQSFVSLDFFVASQRLAAPTARHRCKEQVRTEEILYVSQRSCCSPPRDLEREGVGFGQEDRVSLFSADTAWQVVSCQQTEAGISCLLSCLYVLAAEDEASETLVASAWKYLPFPPFCLGLRLLLEGRTQQMQDPEKAAVAHGMYQLLTAICPEHSERESLFEYSRLLLSHLLQPESSSSATSSPPRFRTVDLMCSVSHAALKEPVFCLRDVPDTGFNREAALQCLSESAAEKIVLDEDGEPDAWESEVLRGRAAEELVESLTLSRLVRAYAPMTECLVMEASPPPSVAVSSDQFPSWTSLRKHCGTEAAQCMRLLSVLSLKSCRCPPKLTKTKEGVVVVFTGHGKSAAGSAVIFDPCLGSEEHMDLDVAAKNLSEIGTSFYAELQEKELLEGIIVCLDVSDSMSKHSSFERDDVAGMLQESQDLEQNPSDDSAEALQRHLKRFDLQPGMAYIRQIVQERTTLRAQADCAAMVLEDLRSLARVTPRGSADDARRMVKHTSEFAKVLLEHDEDDPPPEFCCPITRSLMRNAVCAPDGFTYESDAISAWFEKSQSSPMTGQRLADTTLVPNHVLRSQIQDWCDCHPAQRQPPAVSEQGELHVVCYMPTSSSRAVVELSLPATATPAVLKQQLRSITFLPAAYHLIYHAGNLLPELVELRTAGIRDGSPLEVFTSAELAHTRHRNSRTIRVLLESSSSSTAVQFEVGSCELVISLKCRLWAGLPKAQQRSSGPSRMDLWFNLHEAGDGFLRGTLLSDDHCVGLYAGDAQEIKLEFDLSRQGREKIRVAKASGRYLDRLTVVKQLFNAFIDRSLAYNNPCAIGLICFGSSVEEHCELTPAYESFRDSISEVKPDGDTRLFDALQMAAEKLDSWKAQELSKPGPGRKAKPPKLRLVVLSDGCDTSSVKEAPQVAQFLQSKGVVVDAVMIGNETDPDLHAVCKASGGYVFRPASLQDAVRLNELETFLFSLERPPSNQRSMNSTDSLEAYGPAFFPLDPCSEDQVPPRKHPAQLESCVHGLQDALHQTAEGPALAGREAWARRTRILAEMRYLHREPHPAFDVFPSCDDIGFWKVTVSGPDGTPYAGGVWLLYVVFPTEFPVEPPEVRFITPIKHCNINQHGRVCHSILGRNWTRETRARSLLESIYGLLLCPDVDDPLDSTLALAFYDDSGLYESSIVDHVQRHAKCKTRADWLALLSAPEEQPPPGP